jgi:hypothetical protein
MSDWRKFLALSWRERGFLFFAVCGLMAVGTLLSLAGFERGLAWLRRASRGGRRERATAERVTELRRRAWLIAAAARFGPYRATCLRRSLLLWWLARRSGLEAQLRIGVLREEDALSAHAWVELDGEILNDRSEVVARYARFDAGGLPERVSWS